MNNVLHIGRPFEVEYADEETDELHGGRPQYGKASKEDVAKTKTLIDKFGQFYDARAKQDARMKKQFEATLAATDKAIAEKRAIDETIMDTANRLERERGT